MLKKIAVNLRHLTEIFFTKRKVRNAACLNISNVNNSCDEIKRKKIKSKSHSSPSGPNKQNE